jgi:hypothetical protein
MLLVVAFTAHFTRLILHPVSCFSLLPVSVLAAWQALRSKLIVAELHVIASLAWGARLIIVARLQIDLGAGKRTNLIIKLEHV